MHEHSHCGKIKMAKVTQNKMAFVARLQFVDELYAKLEIRVDELLNQYKNKLQTNILPTANHRCAQVFLKSSDAQAIEFDLLGNDTPLQVNRVNNNGGFTYFIWFLQT